MNHVLTIGAPAIGGYRHLCAACGMDRIVPGERFKHLCPHGPPPRDTWNKPCVHLGPVTEETFTCQGCPGSPRVHALFECGPHGRCLPQLISITQRTEGVASCQTCPDYRPES